MISSKDLLQQTGISRATLNNYIQLGLLPKPEIQSQTASGEARARLLGYFPDAALDRIDTIRQLKREGLMMDDIAQMLGGLEADAQPVGSDVADAASERAGQTIKARPQAAAAYTAPPDTSSFAAAGRVGMPDGLMSETVLSVPLSLSELEQPAYMLNYNLELVWFNEPARVRVFGFNQLPDESAQRSVFQLLSRPEARLSLADQRTIAAMNLRFAAARVPMPALERLLQKADPDLADLISTLPQGSGDKSQAVAETVLQLDTRDGKIQTFRAYAVYFREGVLVVLSPERALSDDLLAFLSRRDRVIEDLLRKRLPVMTPLSVLVADLQHSVRICSELPPDEYFELINQIWSTMAPILRQYAGTYGKHVGDGMVYYFFPQAETNYLFNAVACADELREAMARISSEWQFRKRWFTELKLNIGLHEGQEWLGTFQTTNHVEFVVLGDTINHASRLSDFARHGSIWASKNLVSKLTQDERSRVEFGIQRNSAEFGDRFIPSSYAQIDTLLPPGHNEKLNDIGHIAVTEIRSVKKSRRF